MLPTRVKTHLTRFRYKLYLMRFYSSRQDFFASSIARSCYQGRGEVSLLYQFLEAGPILTGLRFLRERVRNGMAVDKMVSQLGLPNGVKHDTRHTPHAPEVAPAVAPCSF